jgi:hypothetical protein
MGHVHVRNDQVHVENLVLASREVAGYLERVPEPDRPERLTRAAEVGVFCLERASAARDIDFVRQQLDQQLQTVTAELNNSTPKGKA